MKIKNLIAAVLSVSVLFSAHTVCLAEETADAGTASVTLGESPVTSNISKVEMGTNSKTVHNVAHNGREGWQLVSSSLTSSCLNIDISDSFAFEVSDGSEFTVEVDYFDIDNGVFNLKYEALDGKIKETQAANVGSSKEWKTAVFVLSDGYFGNGLDGFDLSVCVRSDIVSRSMGNVSFGEVRIYKDTAQNPVLITAIESEELGNIFGNGEEKRLSAALRSMSTKAETFDVLFEVLDSYKNVVDERRESVTLSAGENREIAFSPNVDRYGLYTLRVSLIGENMAYTKEAPFSYINSDEEGKRNDKFGFNTHFGQEGYDAKEGFEVIKKSNAGFIRKSFYWSNVEKEKGNLNIMDSYGDIVSGAAENEFAIQCLLAYGNRNYDMDHSQTFPTSEEQIEAFSRYCQYVANELIDHGVEVQAYEIWNEPNLKSFNQTEEPASAYVRFAEVTEKALHDIDEDAKVGILALANIHADSTLQWAEEVYGTGLVDEADAMTLHNYNYTSYPEEVAFDRIVRYKDLYYDLYGKYPEIHLTEWGYSAYRGIAQSEYIQGIYDIRQYLYLVGKDVVDTLSYYDFANDGAITTYLEHMHGAVQSQDARVTEYPYAAKESFAGFANMNKLLRNAECVQEISDTEELFAFMYQRDDHENVIAAWTQSVPKLTTIRLDTNTVSLYDWYGNCTTMVSDDGCFTFNAGEEPLYIEGDFTSAEICDNPVAVSANEIILPQNDTVTIELQDPDGETIDFEYAGTKGIEVARQDENTVSVTPTGSVGKKDKLTLYIQKDGGIVGYIPISVEVSESVSSVIYAMPSGKETINYWDASVLVTNHSISNTITGSVVLLESDDITRSRITVPFDSIPAGCTGNIRIELPKLARLGIYDIEYQINIDGGGSHEFNQKIDFTAAIKTDIPPVIDGVMEGEWEKKGALICDDASQIYVISGYDWGGIDDLSSETYIMVDDENLYMFSKVRDDIFFAEAVNESAWANDSIQFGIAFARTVTDEFIGGTFTEILLSKTPEGDTVWRSTSENNELATGKITAAELAVIRDEEYTCYELKLPWTEIRPDGVDINELEQVGFSMLVNDNDGGGRKGWAEYGSGIGKTKDTSLFTFLSIVK